MFYLKIKAAFSTNTDNTWQQVNTLTLVNKLEKNLGLIRKKAEYSKGLVKNFKSLLAFAL